jgi:fucose 4-O-acetylase-like acetyltransferase
MRSNSLEMGCYLMWPITSVAAVVVWNNAAKYFEHIQGKTTVARIAMGGVKCVGQNSLYLYVTHSLIIVPVSAACSKYSEQWQFAIMCIVLIITLPVGCYFSKRVLNIVNNWMINNKYGIRKQS